MGEAFPLLGRETVPEGQDQLGERVGARAPVDDVVGAVVRVVPTGAEGEARALSLALQIAREPLALLHGNLEEPVDVGGRVVLDQLTRDDDGTGALAGVLDPVIGADDATLPIAQRAEPP